MMYFLQVVEFDFLDGVNEFLEEKKDKVVSVTPAIDDSGEVNKYVVVYKVITSYGGAGSASCNCMMCQRKEIGGGGGN